ncbi:DUF2139 domain-containing protein [Desulfurococcus mucosus]|uniref:DUF2139 domain-containing protein n=1 Tax=Desulfurococcus mucosus (strain ATCC 35584 / DSM 2162 / JCM 9187 / O7/1) TaxID=765177 RepID=E8R916_DESM0|nr:DUF2139 domain-containing protein [Desulfurococcus mucosus]ADV64992.1 hypothetical protein Desmu_0685 [Desulfurococcus mucosus DSM 2162]
MHLYPPRYGPEWGSGGIFGLTYHRGVLYYTVAMEAEAHFIHDDGFTETYRFQGLGPGPASGGDTYNAVDVVDDEIFFGGWVHNPALYKGKTGGSGEIDFRNKYSHIHVYSVAEHSVKLLWSESIHDEYKWAGEVSQITYDPVNDRLLIGRADGHVNLGIYSLPRRGGRVEKVSETPGLKGALFLDYACFDMQPNWLRGVDGIQCVDLVSGQLVKYSVESWSRISVDGGGVEMRGSGYGISAYTRYLHFFRGGVLVGNPVEPWIDEPRFMRLFDFGRNPYAPQRSNALVLGGGILAPFNAYTHGFLHGYKEGDNVLAKHLNTVVGPSVLVYITPPQARIVMALGARVTSMAKRGGEILVGYSTTPNLGGRDASPLDAGVKGITIVSEESLLSASPPPVVFRVYGWMVEGNYFGGIPLSGYREPRLVIDSKRGNRLTIYHYDAGLPPDIIEESSLSLGEGRSTVDLKGYWGIVSFRLEEADPSAKIYIILN